MDVDTTGLMAVARPNWEERAKQLARADLFQVKINPRMELWEALTPEEQSRLRKKLRMVERGAAMMAAGMVKGTVKYPGDNYHLPQWFAHLLGEGADQMNYQLLLAHAYEELQQNPQVPPTHEP